MPEKAPKPLHTVAGDTFVWNSPDPDVGEVRIPLKFKTKLLLEVADEDNELRTIRILLRGVLDEATWDQVMEMDAGEMKSMFMKWQAAWVERSEATFPES